MAYALECHVCVTGLGSGCEDPFDASGNGVEQVDNIAGKDCSACNKVKTGESKERLCNISPSMTPPPSFNITISCFNIARISNQFFKTYVVNKDIACERATDIARRSF